MTFLNKEIFYKLIHGQRYIVNIHKIVYQARANNNVGHLYLPHQSALNVYIKQILTSKQTYLFIAPRVLKLNSCEEGNAENRTSCSGNQMCHLNNFTTRNTNM